MASCDFSVDWSEAPDAEQWLPLWTQEVPGWQCVRTMQRPYLFAVCAHGPSSLASASAGSLAVTDTNTWAQLHEVSDEHVGDVTALMSLLRLGMLISGCDEGSMSIWSCQDMRKVRSMRAHDGELFCLSPVGDRVVSSGADGKIIVWRPQLPLGSEWQIDSVLWADAPAMAVEAAPRPVEGFFTGDAEGQLLFWTLQGGSWEKEELISCHELPVEAIVRNNSATVFTLDSGGTMGCWECDDGMWLVADVISAYTGPCWAISLEGLLLAGDARGCMKFWRFLTPGEFDEAPPMLESDDESEGAASFEEGDAAAMVVALESDDDVPG